MFGRSKKTISEHINNIYNDAELEPDSTIRKFRTVALEGAWELERLLDHYNLDDFLTFNEQDVLANSGHVSHQVALQLAEQEYEKFSENRRAQLKNKVSDFDAFISKVNILNKPASND